jgi:lysozyme
MMSKGLALIQDGLRSLGYDPGPIDGAYGPKTVAAIMAAGAAGFAPARQPAPPVGAMTTSPDGIFALAVHEGIVPAPYRDSVDVWTYGIGHTAAAGNPEPAKMPRGMPADLDRALQSVLVVFRRDLAAYEADVRRALKVPVTQPEFDALVSFHYNTGAIGRASLVDALNRNDRSAAASGFMVWVKPQEVMPRRKAEQALFCDGTYPPGPANVWQADATGRVIWKTVMRLDQAHFIALMKGA